MLLGIVLLLRLQGMLGDGLRLRLLLLLRLLLRRWRRVTGRRRLHKQSEHQYLHAHLRNALIQHNRSRAWRKELSVCGLRHSLTQLCSSINYRQDKEGREGRGSGPGRAQWGRL
jgi:hypothetical protein